MKNIKKISFTIILVLFALLRSNAQIGYQTSVDPENPKGKILQGVISKSILLADSSFTWYKANQDIYTPDSAFVHVFAKAKDSVQFIIFGGTWCEDTQFILPRFFKLQEAGGVADSVITFFGVDRAKKTYDNFSSIFNITSVPTIIVMKHGKELGRVVEYGKTGQWDKELADIVATAY